LWLRFGQEPAFQHDRVDELPVQSATPVGIKSLDAAIPLTLIDGARDHRTIIYRSHTGREAQLLRDHDCPLLLLISRQFSRLE
jgi:hypothetical protein